MDAQTAFLQNIGGRKFVLALTSILMTGALQYLGKIDITGNTYFLVITGALAAFSTANVLSKKGTTNVQTGTIP